MSVDPMNPFKMPGSDIFNKDGMSPKPSSDIFAKPKGGGGAAVKQKAEQVAKEENDRHFEDFHASQEKITDPEPPPKPVVDLSKPRWSDDQGYFNEKVTASADGKLPPEIAHITRCDFTLFALPADGKRERIDAKSEHLRDGKASVEFTLYRPSYRDAKGELPDKCDYLFTAKHRDSKEVTSERLTVIQKKSPCQLYQERLKEAVSKLKGVGFGSAEGGLPEGDELEKMDREDWHQTSEVVNGFVYGVTELLPGKSFADALIKIADNPGKWSFDCMQFLQVANLYAIIDPEKKADFDGRVGATKRIRKFPSQSDRPYESTGLRVKRAYQRNKYDAPMVEYPTNTPSTLSIEALLKMVPVGSRVTWKCLDASPENHTRGFTHENTIKIGNDVYAGHPFVGSKGLLNRQTIEIELGRIIYDGIAESEMISKIKTRIFICDISVFETPCSK